jgi:hypothetical protein
MQERHDRREFWPRDGNDNTPFAVYALAGRIRQNIKPA